MFHAVLGLMMLEVAALLLFVLLQGFGGFRGQKFHIDEWVLATVSGGILLQTFALAKIITEALFPVKSR